MCLLDESLVFDSMKLTIQQTKKLNAKINRILLAFEQQTYSPSQYELTTTKSIAKQVELGHVLSDNQKGFILDMVKKLKGISIASTGSSVSLPFNKSVDDLLPGEIDETTGRQG